MRERLDSGVPVAYVNFAATPCPGTACWAAAYCSIESKKNAPAKFVGEESSSVNSRARNPNFRPCAPCAMVVKF